jgi:septal ring-binding cell division protein DamX
MSVVPIQPKFEYRAPHLSEEEDGFGYEGSSGHLAALFIAVVLLSSIAFLMGYYLHAGRTRHTAKPVQASTAPAASTATQAPPPTDGSSPAAGNPSGAPLLPLDVPGLVLQVGAMASETNADALSATLRQKNFPAFVFKHGNDRLYRVVVGPFKNEDSATSTKTDLEGQGFTPLLKNWTPE